MGLKVAYLTKFLLLVLGLVFYCEFLIYYVVLLQVSDTSYAYYHLDLWSEATEITFLLSNF
jgi:hypothetical protein